MTLINCGGLCYSVQDNNGNSKNEHFRKNSFNWPVLTLNTGTSAENTLSQNVEQLFQADPGLRGPIIFNIYNTNNVNGHNVVVNGKMNVNTADSQEDDDEDSGDESQ
ncbi:uncharacterized protein LOC131949586 [Physella acuta]|uniref:uncharacterized protein LOC131949586 n=1 Tax=Physella acuta TaxID=109671 RepID=UPI0027DD9DA1|nr:uncharacterized protein LOC131949586 [Physella acuta]